MIPPEIADAASGIALLYLSPDRAGDEYSDRLIKAMKSDDLDEIEHVTALMVVLMKLKNPDSMEVVNAAWHKIWKYNEERING